MLREIVIQPTSLCNLDCRYCYVPGRHDPRVMKDEVLEATFRAVFEYPLSASELTFIWHAGEPLLAGRAFFATAFDLTRRFAGDRFAYKHSIQTNATLIDLEWCKLFQGDNVSIGISVDGPAFLHDSVRTTRNKRGSHATVMKAVECLRRAHFELAAICVLTSESLNHPEEIFRYFLLNGFSSIAFNIEEVDGVHVSSTLFDEGVWQANKDRCRQFFERLYDVWRPHSRAIRIREFDRTIAVAYERRLDNSYGLRSIECERFASITVTRVGDVVPNSPEFASFGGPIRDRLIIGNILSNTLAEMEHSREYDKLYAEIARGKLLCESTCDMFPYCGSRYISNKLAETGKLDIGKTKACELHSMIPTQAALTKVAASNLRRI